MNPTLADFGHDPWWITIIKIVAVFAFLVVMTLFAIWYERRVVARMQVRPGPNRVGPFGLLQSLADGLKLAFKEDIMPTLADKAVYFIAPVISTICAFTAFAVMPFGPLVSMFGHKTPLQLTDNSVAVLVVLACSAMGVYGIVLGGYASGSTYPLLGGVRSAAQVISYEVAMGLSIVAVFISAGTMSTSGIVAAQAHGSSLNLFGHHFSTPGWNFILIPSVIIYFVAGVGETNRAPFDLPEAESELVGGFHTEYSSLKFALFFLAEYINMVTVSALCATLFFGGWRAPAPLSFWEGANSGWWPMLWFTLKLWTFLFVFIWLRGTLPRLRYDQFMTFGWKVLIPAALVWLMLVATVRAMQNEGYGFRDIVLWVVGGVIALLLISFVVDIFRDRADERREAEEAARAEEPFDPMAGGFPVPPLPGQTLPPVPRRPSRGPTAKVGAAEATDTADRAESEATRGKEGDRA